MTALINEIILPLPGEREVHGNASFQPEYFERSLQLAKSRSAGLAFLHSHPSPGWQSMSSDDINAELSHSPAAHGITGLPLVGLTIGSDGAWSGRFWERRKPRSCERKPCTSVRVVGERRCMRSMRGMRVMLPVAIGIMPGGWWIDKREIRIMLLQKLAIQCLFHRVSE